MDTIGRHSRELRPPLVGRVERLHDQAVDPLVA